MSANTQPDAPSPEKPEGSKAPKVPDTPSPCSRRRALTLSAGVLGGVGACALAVPFLDSLRDPEARLKEAVSAHATRDVDLASLAPGHHMTVPWRNWPVFILHRTPDMLHALQDPALLSRLRDPDSRERQQPPDATNPWRSVRPQFAVLIGICTHLGCIPNPRPVPVDPQAGGWFCGCHGSQFDGAGRVLRNMPAAYNLPVPPVRYLNDTTLRLGESAGNGFTMQDIVQL
ncbi:ubiquinol-cytochrome c reductase iron-sulfur subunit [Oecophyllibacter saccharovorans]|uniref:Ubiquinol-cytochrome c reductase iron-sulfur subunit n=1 Tax=Oecophyllibacter saccharovorans TaxID=2558360 RepID=A0A506URS0_9PROT|nr:ubiquinol-cytochrome c reductase iron-sulfur subunit [Oecophyllibacter saccharovorans]